MLDGPRPTHTANQVVAYNLKRARDKKGWTLEETAIRLTPYVGKRWTRQNIHALERSLGNRPRRFDADDLLAFSRAFELPISWFLIPPDYVDHVGSTPQAAPASEVLDLLFARNWDEIRHRLAELPEASIGPDLATRANTLDLYAAELLIDAPKIALALQQIASRINWAWSEAVQQLRAELERQEPSLFDRWREHGPPDPSARP